MKRSRFLWAVLCAAAVFMLWVGFCFFVVGLVIGAPTYRGQVAPRSTVPTYWSPAAALFKGRQSRPLAHLLSSLVNGLWRVAPYSRAPRPEAEAGSAEEEVELLILRHHYDSGGRTALFAGHMVVLVPKGGWTTYDAAILSVWPEYWTSLSRGEVLLYVFLLPGVHFGLVAFVLVGAVSLLTRVLIRPTPEGVAAPPGGKQEGAQRQ